jgi:hypothetical protein
VRLHSRGEPLAGKRKPQVSDVTMRIRNVIALDAAQVMKRLSERQDEMVRLFSRLRDREPMLLTLRSWFATVTFGEMAALEPVEQMAVSRFYALLAELQWYLQYTEDMPSTVQQILSLRVKQLHLGHAELTRVLGPPSADAVRTVDVSVVKLKTLTRKARGGPRA